MAYADWLFVKRVVDSKQSRSSRKRGVLSAGDCAHKPQKARQHILGYSRLRRCRLCSFQSMAFLREVQVCIRFHSICNLSYYFKKATITERS
jgi:hypothetical protein